MAIATRLVGVIDLSRGDIEKGQPVHVPSLGFTIDPRIYGGFLPGTIPFVRGGYACEKCGAFGVDKEVVESHEKEPVQGLELTVGGLYAMGTSSDRFVLITQQYIEPSHVRLHIPVVYSMNGVLRRMNINRLGHRKVKGAPEYILLNSGLQDLSEEGYQRARGALEALQERPPSDRDEQWGTRYSELQRLRRDLEYPVFSLSRGHMPLQTEPPQPLLLSLDPKPKYYIIPPKNPEHSQPAPK